MILYNSNINCFSKNVICKIMVGVPIISNTEYIFEILKRDMKLKTILLRRKHHDLTSCSLD